MGRSVDIPRNTEFVQYMHLDYADDDSCEDDWEWFKEDLNDRLMEAFPSLSPRNTWSGECHGFLGNRFGTFYLSNYCGLVALAFALADDLKLGWGEPDVSGLAGNWAAQAEAKTTKMFERERYIKLGTASNGEAFFQKAME